MEARWKTPAHRLPRKFSGSSAHNTEMPEAFGPLVEKHQQRVFSLVYHLVRRRDEVEDLAQEIFIKAFRAIRSYNFQSSFATWLSRIATNHCYDYLRHERVPA